MKTNTMTVAQAAAKNQPIAGIFLFMNNTNGDPEGEETDENPEPEAGEEETDPEPEGEEEVDPNAEADPEE